MEASALWVTDGGLLKALGLSFGTALAGVVGNGELFGVGFNDLGFAWVVFVDG